MQNNIIGIDTLVLIITGSYDSFKGGLGTLLKRNVDCVNFNSENIAFPKEFDTYGWISTDTIESGQYFYHTDHLGSSSWITDVNNTAIQHLQNLPYGDVFVDQRDVSSFYTPYKFTSKEQDEETQYSYFGARYYTPEFLNIWLNVDPMTDKYPNISPYTYCNWNPVNLIDPNGKEIDPEASGAKEAAKEAKNQPKFAEIYKKWKDDPNVLIRFNETSNKDSKEGGSIGYNGQNGKGQNVYNVNWDASITKELGTSGIFEESYHLKEAIEGKEMAFAKNSDGTYGVKGLDIYDEVRAKQWVVNNIKDVKRTYNIGNDYSKLTHYGQVSNYKNTDDLAKDLINGISPLAPIDRGLNRSNNFGSSSPGKYVPIGFTGGYKTFSPIKLYP